MGDVPRRYPSTDVILALVARLSGSVLWTGRVALVLAAGILIGGS